MSFCRKTGKCELRYVKIFVGERGEVLKRI